MVEISLEEFFIVEDCASFTTYELLERLCSTLILFLSMEHLSHEDRFIMFIFIDSLLLLHLNKSVIAVFSTQPQFLFGNCYLLHGHRSKMPALPLILEIILSEAGHGTFLGHVELLLSGYTA